MKIDILSDLHLDFYFKSNINTRDNVISFFQQIFTNKGTRTSGDVLIVAGDLGHNNKQNIEIIKILQEEFYKHIICVLGNHDYYLTNSEANYIFNRNSFKRVDNLRSLLNKEENIYCLDGEIIEIDGIKFGGADGWYDDSYVKKYFPQYDKNHINLLWREYINDSRLIKGISSFDEIFEIEKLKLKNIYKACDVMITHVNPSFLEEYIDKKYHNNPTNTFFTFDGSKFFKDGSMKYWVFGHTHDPIEYKINNVKFLCNPLGYPHESGHGEDIIMKSFEI